jgi:hypothetical protein
MNDCLSKIIGLMRYANAMHKLSSEMRGDIFILEREFKEMLQRHWSYIMLHHSLTKDGKTVSWQAIRKYHMGLIGSSNKNSPDYNPYVEKPMEDNGYHFGIELIGNPPSSPLRLRGEIEGSYEILMGRMLDQDGAHCAAKDMNHKAIGICFVGNFDEDPVPEEQWKAGVILVRSLTRLLDIPISFVVPHRNYVNKSCPGNFFNVEKFRKDVAYDEQDYSHHRP